MEGLVLKSTGSWYEVRTEEGTLECRVKGVLRIHGIKATNPVAVGDRVVIEKEADGKGIIKSVNERKNYIIRRSTNLSKQTHILAANIDQAIVMATLAAPRTSHGFIDRFLATAEAYDIPAIVLINKKDVYESAGMLDEAEELRSLYESVGYRSFLISAFRSDDTALVKTLLKDKITLIAGHSGTGKSTLVNAIEPSLKLKTGEISEAHLKGKHTTTFAEMHPLGIGGFVIDTPGIKEFGIVNVEKAELSHFFPEIFEAGRNCKFSSCLHVNEPGCAVLSSVEKGTIAATRYNSYLGIVTGTELEKEYDD